MSNEGKTSLAVVVMVVLVGLCYLLAWETRQTMEEVRTGLEAVAQACLTDSPSD